MSLRDAVDRPVIQKSLEDPSASTQASALSTTIREISEQSCPLRSNSAKRVLPAGNAPKPSARMARTTPPASKTPTRNAVSVRALSEELVTTYVRRHPPPSIGAALLRQSRPRTKLMCAWALLRFARDLRERKTAYATMTTLGPNTPKLSTAR